MLIVLLTTVILAGRRCNAAPHKRASSGKAGISWPVQETTAQPIDAFFPSGSSVAWWFDWNKNYGPSAALPNTPTGYQAPGEFIPTVYAPSYLTDGLYYQSGFQEIMGFNEPDLAQQGTSTPEVAASAWTQLVDTARGTNPSVKLISPAVAFNQTWLSSFFDNICPGWSPTNWGQLGCQYAPDYVAVHMYTTDFDGFTSGVGSYHSTFGLPVVVSEFAAYSFNSSSGLDAAGTSAFMASTTQWLDSQDWVIQYAWFGAMRNPAFLYGVSQENLLMDINGALTALGQQYVAGGQVS